MCIVCGGDCASLTPRHGQTSLVPRLFFARGGEKGETVPGSKANTYA